MSDDKTNPPGAAPPEEDDRTVISPLAGAQDAADDADRTILSPMSTPPEDDDRTLLAAHNDAPPEDLDRTILAAPAAPDTDQTVLASPAGAAPGAPAGAFTEVDTGSAQTPPANLEAAVPVMAAAVVAKEPLRTLEPGSVINNMYRVQQRLDQGGMGRVFKGEEMGTGEPVAIKVILPEMAEDLRVGQMFRREARTLRQLHHDAIVRYFAYVPPDEQMNLHALVMGFIEGTKLSDRLKELGALTEEEVCSLFLRLADGLRTAHKIGIVHRDLSPDNVMLPGDDLYKAVLIDFGISRSSKIKDVTIGNEFAGKLKYVSPEQLGAYGGEAEATSDVYSLGLLMIACLTGKPVPMGDSIVEAVQMRNGVPDLTELPSSFQGLLYKMLQPDPAQRLHSMSEVIEELRAIRGDEGTQRTATGYPGRTAAPARVVPGLQAAPRGDGEAYVTAVPGAGGAPAEPLPVEPKSGVLMMATLAVIAALAVGGGWYYMNVLNADPGTNGATAVGGDGPVRIAGSLSTHLAEQVGSCGYAAARAQGPRAGRIEGMAANPTALSGATGTWPERFGPAPTLLSQQVAEAQCAALDFARTFQGTASDTLEISLDQASVSRAEGVVGTLHGSGGRQNWLALVAPTGRVFSLMGQLEEPIGEARRFAFRLPSAQPGIYIVLATASDDALVRAGAMQAGTEASAIFPLMARELTQDGAGAVDIGILEILP